jgi:hypothetical protein
MNTEEHSARSTVGENKDVSTTGTTVKKQKNIRSSEHVFRELNRLDIEVNEILTNTLKEENRQRLLIKDVIRLVTKNKDSFFIPPAPSMDNTDTMGMLEKAPIMRLATMGRLNSTASRATYGGGTRSSFMTNTHASFTFFNNIVGGTNNNNNNLIETVDEGIQVDDKDSLGLTLDRPEDHEKINIYKLGVAPLAPANSYFPGLDFPYLIRKEMSSFPNVLRVPTAAWTCQSILSIYLDKIETDKERTKKGLPKYSLPKQVYEYYKNCFGLATASDVQVALLLKACDAHIKRQSRISLFASQIGLLHKEQNPGMDVRDTDFILQVFSCLMTQGELVADNQRAITATTTTTTTAGGVVKKTRGTTGHSSGHSGSSGGSVYIRPDISRAIAINTVYTIFEKWLPDSGEDYAIKVRSMQQSELGSKFVDLDLFVETLIEPWHLVRSTWVSSFEEQLF